jgi:hypothetical protein
MAVSNTKKRFDSIYSASKPGKRKSSKFAKIVMRNGDVFRRRNANQYGNAVGNKTYTENRKNRTDKDIFLQKGGGVSDIEMGEGIEMAKRGTTVAKRKSLEKAITKDVEGLFKADSNRAIDSKLRATKAGKRKSKKYARIQRKDGSYFRRRNANQFGDAQGNQTYYEYRKNRTDKNVWLEDGGALPTSGEFVYNIGGLI